MQIRYLRNAKRNALIIGTMNKPRILIIGAGINGLVAANYLQRSGCCVTMIERAERVGGACVSEIATIDGVPQHYALGASVLGLMQDFVFEQTGLSSRLQTFVPLHPKYIFFPGDHEPARILDGLHVESGRTDGVV